MIVYTTHFGITDPLQTPTFDRADSKWQFFCFTDDKALQSDFWQVIHYDPLRQPKRTCRMLKQRPHIIFPDADISLWIDCANRLEVTPESLADSYQGEMSAFRHPVRHRIRDEAIAIIKARKAKEADVRRQLAAYRKEGWDTKDNPQTVLHDGSTLLRRHTPLVASFNDMWNHEVQTRTLRDQMSIDYCAWKAGLHIDDLEGTIRRNPYLTRVGLRRKPVNDY